MFDEGAIEDLLRFTEGYKLVRIITQLNSTFLDQDLKDINLTNKNILILGIERENKWNPIPKGEEINKVGDQLVVYGPIKAINEIFKTTV